MLKKNCSVMRHPILFFLLVNTFCINAELSSQHSFVFPEKISEWTIDGEAGKFAGNDLYKLIDGGADIFFEYGFEEVITQRYSLNNNIISVEEYRMKNPEAAYGIFSLKTMDTGRKIKIGDDASKGNDFIMFRKGSYFFTLTVYEDNSESQKGLMVISEHLSSIIDVNYKQPELCKILTSKEFIHEKVVYIKGNMGLYNLYVFDTQNIFGVQEGVAGSNKSEMNFIFKYNSPEECIKWFDNASGILKRNKKYGLIKSEQREVLFRKGNESILISSAENFIIVSVSKKDDSAFKSVQRILEIIRNQK